MRNTIKFHTNITHLIYMMIYTMLHDIVRKHYLFGTLHISLLKQLCTQVKFFTSIYLCLC